MRGRIDTMKGIERYTPNSEEGEGAHRESIPYMTEGRVSLSERLPMFFDEAHLKTFREEVFNKYGIEDETLSSITEETLRTVIPLIANYFEASSTPDDRLDRAKEIALAIKEA
jgi:hypothetical protein